MLNQNEARVETEKPQVPVELDLLKEQIDDLAKVICVLQERLKPVMRDGIFDTAQQQEEKKTQTPLAPMALEIRCRIQEIRDSKEVILALIETLEI